MAIRALIRLGAAVLALGAVAQVAAAAGPSKPMFVAKADAICTIEAAVAKPSSEALNKALAASDPGGALAPMRAFYATHARANAGLVRLVAPSAVATLYRNYLGARATSLTLLGRLVAAVAAKSASTYEAISPKFESSVANGRALAAKIGFTVCGH